MRRGRSARPPAPGLAALAAICLPLLTGCNAEAMLRVDGWTWLWTLAPIALFALVQGPAIALDRRRPAGRGERLGGRFYLAGLALVVVATLFFVAANLAVEMPPEGKLANLAAWFGGALAGAVGGAVVERQAAAARKTTPAVRLTRRRSR